MNRLYGPILRHWNSLANKQCRRKISALYITGDKANENYVTIQPFMDFEKTFEDKESLVQSIALRRLGTNLDEILDKYKKYSDFKEQIKQLENEREEIALKLKKFTKADKDEILWNSLKERGKSLRNDVKILKENLYPLEDDFIHEFLCLPNSLHPLCPTENKEKVLYRNPLPSDSTKANSHLKRDDLIRFIDNSCYYMMKEAAEFDIYCTQALTNYIVDTGDFLQMSNPDFVRCVLLEANATPMDQYHLVMEETLINTLNPAYLVGGGSFESFLGAVTKLCVYPNVLPLRLVSCGRSYHKVKEDDNLEANLYTATQTNAVQTFVATESAHEADCQMEEILNLAVNFYKTIGIHFRIRYADASELTLSECLRAVIEVYSPAQQRYICVGSVSNYKDFVSKRILFAMRKGKDYHFLHLVGGPLLYTSRLIAALIENNIPLDYSKLLGANQSPVRPEAAIEQFKNIFK